MDDASHFKRLVRNLRQYKEASRPGIEPCANCSFVYPGLVHPYRGMHWVECPICRQCGIWQTTEKKAIEWWDRNQRGRIKPTNDTPSEAKG
jgi:hypothetical protein